MDKNRITFQIDYHPLVWYVVVVTILILSILRGIRFPNLWSYTHFLFNYEFGLVKRGFIGEIITNFNFPYLSSYNFFLIVSALIFLANMILLLLLIRDLLNSRNLVLIGCSIIFVSSLAVVFLSHSIGYFDHVGLLITLVAIRINGFFKKILFLFPSFTLALLVHEAIVVMFFPIIFMSLLFDVQANNFKKQLILLMLFSALIVVLTLFISNATIEKSESREMYRNLKTEMGHSLRRDAFNVLHRNGEDNLRFMKIMWSKEKPLLDHIKSLSVTLPVILTFIYLMVYMLIKSSTNIYLVILAILASLSPLLLHLFGWDMHRWNTLAITTSFVMLYVVYLSTTKNNWLLTKLPNNIYPLVILVTFLNGISTIELFDGYSIKPFPFVEHYSSIIDLVAGKANFLPTR